MRNLLKTLMVTAALCASVTGVAQAEVQDRTILANVSAEAMFNQIVVTATAMCNEAAAQGEVFNVHQCVVIVVAQTVKDLNRPTLTAYARLVRQTSAAI